MGKYIKKKLKIFFKIFFIFLLKFDSLSKILTLMNSLDKFEKKKIFGKEIYLIKKNYITKYRNDTILTKEPETIKWIQEMDKNSILYDVGANVGLYSIISGMLNSKKVVAFEPSFFNLQILSKNIFKNNLTEKILIVPISLNSNINQGFFNLISLEEGGANSLFENEQSISNKNNVFKYNTISLTLDEFFKNFNKLKPDYLKIDVDGIETQILKGGSKVLENVKSVLIESNSTADEEEIIKLMNFFNLKQIGKKKDSYNLIFNKV
tara:strand:- start:33 stop:827 length:795 start_codon:yes stop_codon:yes gene_type:complete